MNSRHYFNEIAQQWNAMRQKYFNQDIRPMLLERIDFKGKSVIDLGAGTGYLSLELAKHARVVFAIDQSQNMLEQIKARADRQNLSNVFTLISDVNSISFHSNQIDIVTMNMALHHIQDPVLIIREIHRLLNEEGIVVISDVMKHEGAWAKKEMHDVWLGFDKNQIEVWLETNGFIEIDFVETKYQAVASSSTGDTINPNIFIVTARKGKKI